MADTFRRDMFEINRAMEFFSEAELEKQLGYTRPWWAAAILRELIDNGLDACEDFVAPESASAIEVTVLPDCFTVRDNGPGIPWSVIERSLDYTSRVTDKASYVSPTRGRQGNALKTVWAAPYVICRDTGNISIESQGLLRTVTVTADHLAQVPTLKITAGDQHPLKGTAFTLDWPGVASELQEARLDQAYDASGPITEDEKLSLGIRSVAVLLKAYALFNPHADFTLVRPGPAHKSLCYLARDPDYEKWTPAKGTPPRWYETPEHLADLAGSLVRAADVKGSAPRPLREFITTFPGLTGTLKPPVVMAKAGLPVRTMREMFTESGEPIIPYFCRLLNAMKEETRVYDPRRLGMIKKDVFIDGMKTIFGCDGDVKYHSVAGDVNGVPYLIEVAFGYRPDQDRERIVIAGVNWSPALRMPFEGLATALQDTRVGYYDSVILAIHLVYPGAAPTDRGKSRYDLPPAISEQVAASIYAVARKHQEAKMKQSRAHANARDKLDRESIKALKLGKRVAKREIKESAYAVMEDAYRMAAGRLNLAAARQVMYSARKRILDTGGKCWEEKNSKYFTQILLPNFIAGNPETCAGWDVVYDARGNFHEPHTGKSIPLGTIQVRNYLRGWVNNEPSPVVPMLGLGHNFPTVGPGRRFNFALFIEKEGFHSHFAAAKIESRFDIGLFSTKGMSTTASRLLVEELSARNVTILVLRDFDKAGFSIVHWLRNSGRRYKFRTPPNVIDLGLRLADAEEIGGVLSEYVLYKMESDPKVSLRNRGANEHECSFLVHKAVGKQWEGERVELNALTNDQLISFVERKLTEHGVKKLIPDPSTLDIAFQRAHRIAEAERAVQVAIRTANAKPARTPPSDLAERVYRLLSQTPEISWDEAIWRVAAEGVL